MGEGPAIDQLRDLSYRRQFIVLFVDGAGNRRSDELKVPDNIMLPFPPYFATETRLRLDQHDCWDPQRGASERLL
jgi:hypothetical protein